MHAWLIDTICEMTPGQNKDTISVIYLDQFIDNSLIDYASLPDTVNLVWIASI